MSDSIIPDGVWLVRGGINDELVPAFQQKGAIALDWRDVGDLALIPSLEDFKARVFQQFRGNAPEYIRDELTDLLWFVRLIDVGDYVLVDDKRMESERFAHDQDIGVLKAFVRELAWEVDDFLQSILDIASRGAR